MCSNCNILRLAGLGGGYNERENVEYKSYNSDDDEFDKLIGRISAAPNNKNTKGITTSKLANLPDGLSSKEVTQR